MEKVVVLNHIRFGGDAETTIGQFLLDGRHECFTIEDEYHLVKQKADTRIWEGEHELKLVTTPKWSAKLGHPMIWIEVRGFDGILIHPLNTEKDTDGCIGPATAIGYDYSLNTFKGNDSRIAYAQLYPKMVKRIKQVLSEGKIPTIKIESITWNPYDEDGNPNDVVSPPGAIV